MSISVLVVDDHADTRREVRALLEIEPDLDVVGEASSGLEALEQIEELRPRVALMDMMMPGLDGIETTRRIRTGFPGVGVVAFSLCDTPAMRDAVIGAGASRFVAKTAAEEELVSAVRSCASAPAPAP